MQRRDKNNTRPHFEEAAYWQAVLNRDSASDGRFVYGVRSTGIFCRPSCPARRPKREHVTFHATPADARKAGLRPCKRCRPDQLLNPQLQRVHEACRVLEAHRDTPLSLAELSRRVGGSPTHLQRAFKEVVGLSPREYSDALRLGTLKTKLQQGESLLDARMDAGYGSSRGLYERAASQLGMTPATYGRGGAGAHIRFGIVPCALGFLLAATTEKGVCSVTLGDTPEGLENALRAEFPAALIERDEAGLQATTRILLPLLEGEGSSRDLPLDVRATAFQWRVWQLLKTISCGQTRSYREIAEMLGEPNASRAVARACATNPVALVVPCHRVVRGDGALAGYRWGVERKRELLERERKE